MMEILKKLKKLLFGNGFVIIEVEKESEQGDINAFEGLGEPEPETVSVHYELVEIDCDDRIIEVTKYVDGTVGRKVIYADNDEERNLNRVVNLLNLKESLIDLQTSISKSRESVNELLLERLKKYEKEEEEYNND